MKPTLAAGICMFEFLLLVVSFYRSAEKAYPDPKDKDSNIKASVFLAAFLSLATFLILISL